jgi:glycosyltransferase involved in cell wall biosynthesis
MTDLPTFSVVVPTHNRVARLRHAIDSVLAQTLADFELIVVDDGSKDATPELLATLPADQCRSLRNETAGGVSAARNRGAAAARAEFVLFLDDDDRLRPDALALLREQFAAKPEADFAWGGRHVCEKDATGRAISVRRDTWATGSDGIRGAEFLRLALDIAASCAFTIRRRVFAAVGGFDEQLRVSEDRDLFVTLAERGYRGRCARDLVVEIDEHFQDSLSRSNPGSGPRTDLRIIAKHREYLSRAENSEFMDSYLLQVYAGFLDAADDAAAMDVVRELRSRGALDFRVARMYVRHAARFRALKAFLRYDSLRRITSRLKGDL